VVDLSHVEGRVEPQDAAHMHTALWYAERGLGHTAPNPIVGAVVVDDEGVVVGVGHHERAGGPHAEIVALTEAGDRARGATLYCTLEPCSHFNRTGPCCVAVYDAGIRRLVAAVGDPNPRVSGRGLTYLRERGVDVTVGVGRTGATRQNAPFFMVMTHGRPWVCVKVAMSLDGAVAQAPGVRTSISGPRANRWTQRRRAETDAIAVGVGTVLADDPVLTAREVYRDRPLVRVVFDRRLRTPPTARLFATLDHGPVAVLGAPAMTESPAADALRAVGAIVLPADSLEVGLQQLVALDVTSVLVEGGPTLHAALWVDRLVDQVVEIVAERALGPGALPTGLPAAGPLLTRRRIIPLGSDVLIEGDVHWTD
jgi:diaminohydroxyphosphoribosylaminopyrimidine deaminase / 5-amino-6-(5-phosphoribosylamino)uracil reductase